MKKRKFLENIKGRFNLLKKKSYYLIKNRSNFLEKESNYQKGF